MRRLISFLAIIVIANSAYGLIEPHIVGQHKSGHSIGEGVFIGGLQGRDLSFLRLNWLSTRSQSTERIELILGESDGGILNGPMGYFHVAVQKNPARIVIDLAQVQRTAIEENAIRRTVLHSKFVASTDFTMDPEDHSTNLTFNLKKPIRVEAFIRTNRQEGGVLVLDLQDSVDRLQ